MIQPSEALLALAEKKRVFMNKIDDQQTLLDRTAREIELNRTEIENLRDKSRVYTRAIKRLTSLLKLACLDSLAEQHAHINKM